MTPHSLRHFLYLRSAAPRTPLQGAQGAQTQAKQPPVCRREHENPQRVLQDTAVHMACVRAAASWRHVTYISRCGMAKRATSCTSVVATAIRVMAVVKVSSTAWGGRGREWACIGGEGEGRRAELRSAMAMQQHSARKRARESHRRLHPAAATGSAVPDAPSTLAAAERTGSSRAHWQPRPQAYRGGEGTEAAGLRHGQQHSVVLLVGAHRGVTAVVGLAVESGRVERLHPVRI